LWSWGSGTGPPPHNLPCSGPLRYWLLLVETSATTAAATTNNDTVQHPRYRPPPCPPSAASSQYKLCGHTTYNMPSINMTGSQCMPTPRKSALLSDKHTTNYASPNVPCCTATSSECINLQKSLQLNRYYTLILHKVVALPVSRYRSEGGP
jgi:hypothetical protein